MYLGDTTSEAYEPDLIIKNPEELAAVNRYLKDNYHIMRTIFLHLIADSQMHPTISLTATQLFIEAQHKKKDRNLSHNKVGSINNNILMG